MVLLGRLISGAETAYSIVRRSVEPVDLLTPAAPPHEDMLQ